MRSVCECLCVYVCVDKANEIVKSEVVIQDSLIAMLPLSMLSKKIILTNVPSFNKDEAIAKELSCYGKLVSLIKKNPPGLQITAS